MLNPYQTIRRPTRTVWVGRVPIGSLHPVQIQSMTTSNTRDAEATALQIMRLADSGCAIARVTVQGMKEAESCEKIKEILLQKAMKSHSLPTFIFFHQQLCVLSAAWIRCGLIPETTSIKELLLRPFPTMMRPIKVSWTKSKRS